MPFAADDLMTLDSISSLSLYICALQVTWALCCVVLFFSSVRSFRSFGCSVVRSFVSSLDRFSKDGKLRFMWFVSLHRFAGKTKTIAWTSISPKPSVLPPSLLLWVQFDFRRFTSFFIWWHLTFPLPFVCDYSIFVNLNSSIPITRFFSLREFLFVAAVLVWHLLDDFLLFRI